MVTNVHTTYICNALFNTVCKGGPIFRLLGASKLRKEVQREVIPVGQGGFHPERSFEILGFEASRDGPSWTP